MRQLMLYEQMEDVHRSYYYQVTLTFTATFVQTTALNGA